MRKYEERLHAALKGPVHTTPEEFENAASLLQLGLLSTLIRHKKWSFSKINALQTRGI